MTAPVVSFSRARRATSHWGPLERLLRGRGC